MVNDPLRFGDLPYQETGERGQTYTRPQPAYIYPPAPVQPTIIGPQPSQQFVDRVAYLQQRLAEMRQRAAQQIAPYRRVQQMTQSLLDQENNRQQQEARQRVQPFLPSGQSTNFGPRSFQDIVDVARTKIPEQVREPVKDFVSQGLQTFASGGPLGRTGMEVASRIPVADKFEDVRQKIVTSASDAAAELVVPREVWDTALELTPGVGTVPDIIKGVREGAPEATRALRTAMEVADAKLAERTGQSLLRGESGALRGRQPHGLPSVAEEADASITDAMNRLPSDVRDAIRQRVKRVSVSSKAFDEGGHFDVPTGHVRISSDELDTDTALHELLHAYALDMDDSALMHGLIDARYPDAPPTVREELHQTQGSSGYANWSYDAQEGMTTMLTRYFRGEPLNPSVRQLLDSRYKGRLQRTGEAIGRSLLRGETGALKMGGESAEEVSPQVIRDAFRPSRTKMIPGARVFATDRNNYGRIISLNPATNTATVYFKSAAGAEATVDLPVDALNVVTQGGRRVGTKIAPLNSAELAQAWEVLPPENQKLVGVIATHSLSESERAARLAASRSAKAGNIAAIFDGSGTPEEKLAAAWASRRGADLPEQPALREFFEDADVESYKQQIVDAAKYGLVSPHEATNAGSILNLILEGQRFNGTKTPITAGERALMGQIFGPEIEKVLPTTAQKLTLLQKALAPFQVWRSLKSGFDNSALGRQGRKLMFSDPVEWARAIGPNLRAISSERGYETVMDQVHHADHYSLGQSLERPLGIIERGTNQADEFMSPLTKHIPLLNASERGYLGFLNAARQATFDKDVNALIKAYDGLENVPISEIQRASDNINNLTMFGNLSFAGENTRTLGQTFFSARGLVSGPQFFGDVVRAMGPNTSPTMRKIIARRFAAYVGSSVASLMLANQVGYMLNEKGVPVFVGTELNPWSQSFGEVRAGPVKFNPWGSEAPLIRAALQFASARQLAEGETEPHKASRNDIAGRLIQTKLSPGASLAFDLFINHGKDFQGRPIVDRPWQYAIEQSSPIFWFDVQDSMKEQGWWGLASIAQSVGGDVQVYGPTARTAEKTEKQTALQNFEKAGLPTIQKGWDSGYWKSQFKSAGFDVDPSKYKTFDDFREAWVDHWVEKRPDGMSEAEARSRMGTAFNAKPVVKDFNSQQNAAELDFWKAHPDLLRQAISLGIVEPSKEKDAILNGN